MQFPDARILIFAKAPRPGLVKTRMIPALGAQGAAELYHRLLADTVKRFSEVRLCPVELWCAPDVSHPLFDRLASSYDLTLHGQVGEGLGRRMQYAAEKGLSETQSVVLIGADCPLLDSTYLRQALEYLQSGRGEAVLGPAEDGGYVLLGLGQSDEALFEDMPWGEDRVLSLTRNRLGGLGWSWCELETLWDLDRPEDLARLSRA